MQVATSEIRNGLPPGYWSWEHYFREAAKDEPPISARLGVVISEESTISFLNYLLDNANGYFLGNLLRLGWDIRRLFGGPDGTGQCILSEFGGCIDAYDPPPEEVYDSDAFYDQLWESFDRERNERDLLLIDLMDEALHYGWDAPPDVREDIEALRDLREALKELREVKDDANWIKPAAPQLPAGTPMPSNVVQLRRVTPTEPLPEHPYLTAPQAAALENFWAHLPSGKIIHQASRALWAAGSADKHIGHVKDAMQANGPGTLATTWLSQNRAVQSMGWDPAESMIIEGKILTESGWISATGCRSFNTYLPPAIVPAAGDVSPWLDHIKRIYPDEAGHIVSWFAHRVQRPGDKVNHGLVFIGAPGIGKDTAIEPVIAAIGAHNFKSITAAMFFKSDFNGYLKSVMLRIDEVHDLGGESKYAFHDRTKPVLAAPPMAHQINEKFVPHHSAVNVSGVILTSNHADALYLAPDDRRHFVCLSSVSKEAFPNGYFDQLYAWFENGGNEAVAYYLANLDLSSFNAKAPPPKTAGWHMIVSAGLAPESGELTDVIEAMGNPAALTLEMIRSRTLAGSQLRLSFEDLKLRKAIPKRLAEAGYIAVPNPDALTSGGRWRMPSGKTMIYARQVLPDGERLAAARILSQTLPPLPG